MKKYIYILTLLILTACVTDDVGHESEHYGSGDRNSNDQATGEWRLFAKANDIAVEYTVRMGVISDVITGSPREAEHQLKGDKQLLALYLQTIMAIPT